jgi:hypothetical protein
MSLLTVGELLSPAFSTSRLIEDGEEGFLIVEELTLSVFEKVLEDVLFALPMPRGGVFLPNPQRRFCLDLRSRSQNWFRNKKVRRHAGDFELSVKTSFKTELVAARLYHMENKGSTWLTDGLISLLDELSQTRRARVQLYCFALVEKTTGATAACSFGFLSGNIFEDFTASTLIKDYRSPGAILNRLVGSLLQSIGVDLWYWGYEVDYMNEYRKSCGAGEVSRRSFYAVLNNAKGVASSLPQHVALPTGVVVMPS